MSAGEFQRAAESVQCGRCGAQPGQPCRTPDGRRTLHRLRDQTVRYAFWCGYEAGLDDALHTGSPDQIARQLDFFRSRNIRVANELSS